MKAIYPGVSAVFFDLLEYGGALVLVFSNFGAETRANGHECLQILEGEKAPEPTGVAE